MIFLTKLDGKEILLNELFIETVTETPDTVITMSNGHTYIVRESMKELQNKILEYNRRRLAYKPLMVPTVERAFPPSGDWSTTTEAAKSGEPLT